MLSLANKRSHSVENHSNARRFRVDCLSVTSAISSNSFLRCRYSSTASFRTDNCQHVFHLWCAAAPRESQGSGCFVQDNLCCQLFDQLPHRSIAIYGRSNLLERM